MQSKYYTYHSAYLKILKSGKQAKKDYKQGIHQCKKNRSCFEKERIPDDIEYHHTDKPQRPLVFTNLLPR
jgi:hypothetical protein